MRKNIVSQAGKIVIKIGTDTLSTPEGRLDRTVLKRLADQIAGAKEKGKEVALVSSGAVGAGMAELAMEKRPNDLPTLQATAAVGQSQLIRTFNEAFKKHNLHAAQILLTRDDFESRTRYLNIRNTIHALHKLPSIPVINENDTVAVDELLPADRSRRSKIGDNDTIAALVTNMLQADLLIILSVVDGLMQKGEVLDVVERIDDDVLAMVGSDQSKRGTGGMGAKLAAISIVTSAGEAAVIANGRKKNVISQILEGKKVGTLFLPQPEKLKARKRWIGMTVRPVGKIHVDDGAANAIRSGRSLLAAGITEVTGSFERGEVVSIVDPEGAEIARGLTNWTSEEIDKIKGFRSSQIESVLGQKLYDEIVHRDNMTIFPG
jgi:glutamate 5-kinase